MSEGAIYRFGDFVLDTGERQLLRADRPVKLNSRYFDALALLVREQGRLVGKELFLSEVWRGVPVGDEALTQCMKTLRQCLGDTAGNPRFIETVPKHGYRFVAPVDRVAAEARPAPATSPAAGHRDAWSQALTATAAGTLGGAGAGVFGGLLYGSAIAYGPGAPEIGAVSMFMVLMALNIIVGAAGGFGVSFGWAAAGAVAGTGQAWRIGGAALGGLAVGGLTSVLGLDLFNLLLGEAPEQMTGAAEGAVLGTAAGLGLTLTQGRTGNRRRSLVAGAIYTLAGMGIVLSGGTLMAGSLDSLSSSIAGADLPLDRITPFFARPGLGTWVEVLLAGLEGLLFCAGVVAAINLVRARKDRVPQDHL